jgi:hypothetical protein
VDPTLNFISTLIWQCIVAGCLWCFRSELRGLFEKITLFKYKETELHFQKTSGDELEPSPVAREVSKIRDESGFFTQAGIERIVKESRYFKEGDQLRRSLLVFSTARQHTWLVRSNSHIFFILDDEGTRASKRLIQKLVPINDALPVEAKAEDTDTGIFQLGNSGFWYYVYSLLGPHEIAKRRLTDFVTRDTSE